MEQTMTKAKRPGRRERAKHKKALEARKAVVRGNLSQAPDLTTSPVNSTVRKQHLLERTHTKGFHSPAGSLATMKVERPASHGRLRFALQTPDGATWGEFRTEREAKQALDRAREFARDGVTGKLFKARVVDTRER